jgi:hypothetical protein
MISECRKVAGVGLAGGTESGDLFGCLDRPCHASGEDAGNVSVVVLP